MIIAFVILIISLLSMIAMLAAKRYEMAAGRQLVAVRARKWTEVKVRQSAHAARGMVHAATSKHFWKGLSSFFCKKFVEKIWHHPRVRHVAKKATDVVRGRKEIKSTGPVSFYLRDVSDHKNQVRSK